MVAGRAYGDQGKSCTYRIRVDEGPEFILPHLDSTKGKVSRETSDTPSYPRGLGMSGKSTRPQVPGSRDLLKRVSTSGGSGSPVPPRTSPRLGWRIPHGSTPGLHSPGG